MSPNIILNPVVPFIGSIGSTLAPGHTIRIQGTILPSAQRFAINLQCGPSVNPRDDVALHLSPDFNRSCVVRNNILNFNWGPEESHGHFPLFRGQPFDILVLCEPLRFKIAVNGQHYTEFEHRIPYNRVTHLAVDGDVSLISIEYGGGLVGSSMPMPMPGAMPIPGYGMPVPGQMPMPVPGQLPMPGQMPVPGYGYPRSPSPGHYPQNPATYPASTPYTNQHPLYPGHNPQTHLGSNNYPAYKKPSMLEQAGMAVAGTAIGNKLFGKSGGMGTAMAGGLAGAALTGHLSPKKALKKQKKAHKKALKYGIPLAGVGLGAYAMHKMSHHSHSSSSSSSSSSSEEE